MKTLYISAIKLQRLFSYFELLGLNVPLLIQRSGAPISLNGSIPADEKISIRYFSQIYNCGAKELSQSHGVLPWAAGMGTDYFELTLRAMISCRTLGEAIDVAVRFDQLMFESKRYRISQRVEDDLCLIDLDFDYDEHNCPFLPPNWKMKKHAITMAKASNLRAWYSIFSWLIGKEVECQRFQIDCPNVSTEYARYMTDTVGCEARFGQPQTLMSFDSHYLTEEVRQNPQSLEHFLLDSTYYLALTNGYVSHVTSAVKSLLSASLAERPLTFGEVAEKLYMSESTLRRKLSAEKSSFQLIKDEIRREFAIDALKRGVKSVSEIAEELGFSETSAFIRSFKSWTGLPPAKFVKQSYA